MAALDGKITIGIDYRPCIVHIPAVIEYYENPFEIIRKVREPEKDVRALFHCWSQRSETETIGQVYSTFAIVEFEDGAVHEVEPRNIRFIDNSTTEYSFEERKL